jgi:hypothetical protein
MQVLDQTKVSEFINSTKGKWVTVTFVKKDGTTRRLTGRTGVRKGVIGSDRKPSANISNPYRILWDSAKMEFRMVNLATISKIQFRKETYIVVQ